MTAAIALDLGTTSIKAGLLAHDGTLGGIVARPAPAIVAHDGRYESDGLAYAAAADGIVQPVAGQGGKIDGGPLLPALAAKYQRWKVWLERLLAG